MDRPKFWQEELFRERSRLQDVIDQEGLRYLAGPAVLLEKFVFVTACIARKPTEAHVLTPIWGALQVGRTGIEPVTLRLRVSCSTS